MELVGGLCDHLLTVEGKTPVIQVDLSDKLNSQSLLFSALKSNKGGVLSILEAVKRWPYCVLLFDKVEKADASVFSTLIRILDTGMLSSNGGLMVDFRNTTLIMISDQGNKEFISRLFGCSCPASGKDEGIQQEESHFRSELLYRLDEIIFFNPVSHDQRNITRLPMIDGRHPKEGGNPALASAFYRLFRKGHDPEFDKPGKFSYVDYVDSSVSYISKLLGSG